ncbi:hypothetical protein KAH55_10150 [bacterium]|nr:hypothetical protein [bacterium]
MSRKSLLRYYFTWISNEPFYRVDKSRTKATGGYGLGMSLCRDIMKAHGGSIDILSEEGKGSTIQLLFPAIPKNTRFFSESPCIY